MPIIEPQAPPEEIPIWKVGPLPTEYGTIDITESLLRNGFDNWKKRGRKLAFSYEHPKGKSGDMKDHAAPAWCDLELRNFGQELWATKIHWTQHAALSVGSGEWLYTSPEFHPGTDFKEVLDFKKIALTTDPATWGASPILPIGQGLQYAFSLSEKEFSPVMAYAIPDKDPTKDQDGEEPKDGGDTGGPTPPTPPTPPTAEQAPPKDSIGEADDQTEEANHVAMASELVGIMAAITVSDDVDEIKKKAALGAAIARQLAEKEALETAKDAQEPPVKASQQNPEQGAPPQPPQDAQPLEVASAAPVSPMTSGKPEKDKDTDDMDPEKAQRLSICDKFFSSVPTEKLEGHLFGLTTTIEQAKTAITQLSINSKSTEEGAKKAILKAAIEAGKISEHDTSTQKKMLALSLEGMSAAVDSMLSFSIADQPKTQDAYQIKGDAPKVHVVQFPKSKY